MIAIGSRNPPWRRLMATCAAPCPAPTITAEPLIGFDTWDTYLLGVPCWSPKQAGGLKPRTGKMVNVRLGPLNHIRGKRPPGDPLNWRPLCVHVGTARTGGGQYRQDERSNVPGPGS